VLRIQSPTILATFAAVACAYPLLSLRRHRETLITNLLALAVSVVGLAALVGPFGAQGAAVATLAAEVTLAVSTAILLRRSHTQVRFSFVTIAWVLAAICAAIGAGFATGLPSVPRIIVGVLVYGAVLLVSRRIPPELLQAVRR
jgi:O-antigen/teichoic acid export membrane protein